MGPAGRKTSSLACVSGFWDDSRRVTFRMIRLGRVVAAVMLGLATAAPAADPEARPVVVEKAELGEDVSGFSLTGSVTARRVSRLSPRTSGLIRKLHVDAGDKVEVGQLLMELDSVQAEISLELIRSQKRQAELALTDARRLVEEAKALAEKGGFARSEALSRDTDSNIKEFALRFFEKRELEQVDIIERHKLPAPFAGVIRSKMAEEGEWVQTGTPVLELVETGDLRFDVQAPQELFARSAGNAEVRVRLDSHPGVEFPATILARVPAKDLATRSFLIRLDFEDPRGLAAHGMSGTADFTFRNGGKTLQVPRDAVIRRPDGTTIVWIVEGEGDNLSARSREVRTGDSLGPRVEVLEGLSGGERVVVLGNEGLREDQAVRLQSAPSPNDS